MTGFAGIGAVDMAYRFTAGNRAIVTTETGADDLGMIHRAGRYRRPWRRPRCMAQATLISTVDMGRAFA